MEEWLVYIIIIVWAVVSALVDMRRREKRVKEVNELLGNGMSDINFEDQNSVFDRMTAKLSDDEVEIGWINQKTGLTVAEHGAANKIINDVESREEDEERKNEDGPKTLRCLYCDAPLFAIYERCEYCGLSHSEARKLLGLTIDSYRDRR